MSKDLKTFAESWVERNVTDAELVSDVANAARNYGPRFMADARANGAVIGEQNSFAEAALVDALTAATTDARRFPQQSLGNDNLPERERAQPADGPAFPKLDS